MSGEIRRGETGDSSYSRGLRAREETDPTSSSYAEPLTRRVWSQYGGDRWRRYKAEFRLGLWLLFKNSNLEAAYVTSLKPTYRHRNAFAGFYVSLLILVMWPTLSSLLRDHRNNGSSTLAITDSRWTDAFDVLHGLSLALAILLIFSHLLPAWCTNNPEIMCYLLTAPFYILWILWILGILADSAARRDDLLAKGLVSTLTSLQFKLWTDTTVIVILFILCTIYDLMLNTRTWLVVWIHFFNFALYASSRCIIFASFTDFKTKKRVPAVTLTSVIQLLVVFGLLLQAYLGRLLKEITERMAFIDLTDDKRRLQELRDAQRNKKKGKGETVIEDLLFTIRKAQTSLRSAAFENSAQGDSQLIELDELLRQCTEILLDTDDVFAVGVGGDGDEEEDRFLRMFQTAKAKHAIIGSSGKKKCGEDHIRITYAQQQFFTTDIMPQISISSTIRDQVGRVPNMKILDLQKNCQNLLVEFGLVLLEDKLDFFSIDQSLLSRYLYSLQRRYYPNPYHGPSHGAMVAHMATCIARLLQLEERVSEKEMACLAIAGLGHDVGHPGRNNNFFISQSGMLSRVYNDNAILENYHCFLTFRYATIAPETNIFQNLAITDYRSVRALIIEFILITDMAQHFASISKFRVRRASEKFNPQQNLEDAQLVLRICIKMADLSHALVDWPQHMEWSMRVTQEFYAQGDEEKSLNLPISPLCDRSVHRDFPKSQSGFLQFVVLPLANELTEVDPSGLFSGEMVTKLLFNKHKWEMLKEKGDPVNLTEEIEATQTAPSSFADCVLVQALQAKTVDELNSDPMAVDAIRQVVARAVVKQDELDELSDVEEEDEEEGSENNEEEEEEEDLENDEEEEEDSQLEDEEVEDEEEEPEIEDDVDDEQSEAESQSEEEEEEEETELEEDGEGEIEVGEETEDWEEDDLGLMSPRGGPSITAAELSKRLRSSEDVK